MRSECPCRAATTSAGTPAARIRDTELCRVFRNVIGGRLAAARLGVSKATVSAAAQITGTEFSAASTRALTEAVIGGARLRRAKMAAEALATAEQALSKAKAASDATEAKGWAVVFGVMIDKSLVLEGRETADHGAAQRAESEERMAEYLH